MSLPAFHVGLNYTRLPGIVSHASVDKARDVRYSVNKDGDVRYSDNKDRDVRHSVNKDRDVRYSFNKARDATHPGMQQGSIKGLQYLMALSPCPDPEARACGEAGCCWCMMPHTDYSVNLPPHSTALPRTTTAR